MLPPLPPSAKGGEAAAPTAPVAPAPLTSIIASMVLTPHEAHQILSNLDENKATGPDKISAILFKNCG